MKSTITKYIVTAIALFAWFQGHSQVTIYSQDFEGTYPWGMTTSDLTGSAPSHVWTGPTGPANQTGGTGNYANADSDEICDSDPWNSVLQTPVLDFSNYNGVTLTFRSRLRIVTNNADEEGHVEVSTNGGTSWASVYSSLTTQPNGGVAVNVNLGAYDLTPNVLVRWRYVDNFLCAWYWQIDNVVISGNLAVPCTSPPTAGTTVSNSASVCTGSSVNLSLSGGTGGIGQTYQWQSSPDNITWTNVPAGTTPGLTSTINDTTWFRSIVTCSGLSDTSSAVMVATNFMLCYCNASYAFDCSVDYTANVIFNTINNSSGCGGGTPLNYSNYTNISTNVIQGATYPLSVTTDGDADGVGVWIDYDHSGTFDASEFVLSGFTGNVPETYTTNVTIPLTALTGPTRMRIRNHYDTNVLPTESCTAFGFGETEEYTIVIFPPPADDAGLANVVSPTSGLCSFTDSVIVTLVNNGTNALTVATVNVVVNGGTPVTFPWTGNIAPGATSTIYVGNVVINDGDLVEIFTTNPNGTADVYTANDTIASALYTALTGTYTVGGATPDFTTVTDAADALALRGVCGPVVFNIRPGTYTEQISIGSVIGSSSTNTVTFQSESLDSTSVTLTYTPGGTADNYIVELDGASYITLNQLTLSSTSAYAIDVMIRNNAHHITIQNSVILSDTMHTGSTFEQIPVYGWYEDQETDIIIRNNVIRGGSRGIQAESPDHVTPDANWVVEGNTISDFTAFGMVFYNGDNHTVANNTIVSDDGGVDVYRIVGYSVYNGLTISGNYIGGEQNGIGIYAEDCRGGVNAPALFSNNFIYMGDSASNGDNYGIAILLNSIGIDVVNNSIHTYGLDAASAGIGLIANGISNVRVLNNNVYNDGMGYALYSLEFGAIAQSNHNNLITDGTRLSGIAGTNYANLSAHTSGTGMDVNSVSVNPLFVGTDLHTCRIELDNVAMVYPGITMDYDRDIRNTQTPDIGADEFITVANFTLGPDIVKCPSDSVVLGAEIINSASYYWSPTFENTPTVSTTQPGLFVVQIAGDCGTIVDSIVVANYPMPVASFSTTNNFYTVVTNNTSTNAISYIWNFGDGNTSTDAEPSHVYATNGTYTITLSAISQCGDTVVTTQSVTVNPQFAGIDEVDGTSLNVYPNPSNGLFNLNLVSNSQEKIQIVISDLSGRLVYQKQFGNSSEFTTEIDLRGLSSGSYMVRVISGNYSAVTKIIIQ